MKKLYSMGMLKRTILAIALCGPSLLFAQENNGLAPVSRTFAIINVNIVQAPGRKIDMGTVVLKDGLIVSVGKNIAVPADAIIIKADSMYMYAGFIDGLSRVGITKPKEEPQGQQPLPKDRGNPKPEEAGITPQVDVRSFLNPWDKSVEELRSVGFTAAHVVPHGGMMPGTGSIILLGGRSADEMVLVSKSSFFSELAPAQRVYPSTVMGVMAKYRELYRQAALSRSYENMYASNRSGIQRPTTDRVLESLYPVVDKRMPVLFKVEKVMDAQRVLTLQSDLGFNLLLAELKEGWDIISKVKASNAKVFLSLDLPEDKKEGEGDAKNDDKAPKKGDMSAAKAEKKSDGPKTAADLEKEALEKRKADFTAKYVGQASAYQKAGMKFGFSTINTKASNIQSNLRRMITAGLTEDAALASLTTSPAELLGLSDRLGTIDNGKIANLVISDKPYFNEKSKVRYVFVEGTLYKLEDKEAKKSETNVEVDFSGDWSMTTEAPDRKYESTFTLKKDGNNYSGTMTGDLMSQPVALRDVSVDGSLLSFSYSLNVGDQLINVTVNATIEGDTFKGAVTTSEYGSFAITGKKNPK